jgi:mono/diheme cytochrome c family protein
MKKYIGVIVLSVVLVVSAYSNEKSFRQAPASARKLKNPYTAREAAVIKEGASLFEVNCASCHGKDAMGTGNVPALARGPVQSANDGEVFWFVGKGSPENGMPPSTLSEQDRWKVVTFIKSLNGSPAVAIQTITSGKEEAPAPPAPFTDYRYEKPGQTHKILPSDLPTPMPDTSVGNAPEVVARPDKAWPKVPAGFRVQLYANGFDNPRLIRTAPNGDFFLAESSSGKIKVLRGITAEGKSKQMEVFARGLDRPYGIAFYPPGKDPKWVYVGNESSVVRFPYKSGDLHASAGAQKITDLPSSSRGHWTRDIQFSLDGEKMFVAVGSGSNVDDPDTTPGEKNRADILVMNPDGSEQKVYAYGIRNAGGGWAIISFPITSRMFKKVVITVGRGGISVAIRIHVTRENIRN